MTTLTALLASGGATAAPGAGAAAGGCKVANNIEAIIDDSGSMSSTDSEKNRTKLLDAFAALQPNQGKTLGGVEFGDTAGLLFSPAAIPGVVPAMDASFGQVDGDNGSTDYNLAFAASAFANPAADGRIFLSDGGHNVGTYNNAHLSPNVKTDSVGFGSADSALLGKIAADTGGTAFDLDSSSQVPAVAAGITADMSCKQAPVVFIDTFTNPGQQFGHVFKSTGKQADILLTWQGSTNVLDVLKFNQTVAGKSVAHGSASLAQTARKGKGKGKGKRVKFTRTAGSGFVTVHLKGLKKKGKVKFRVKARTLTGSTTATTSVIR